MRKAGYILYDNVAGAVTRRFDDTLVDANNRPALHFVIPETGDAVHAPAPGSIYGAEGEYTFFELWHDDPGSPSLWHSQAGVSITIEDGKAVERQLYSEVADVVPQKVSPLQMRRALRQLGLKAQVDSYIAALPAETKEVVEESWDYALDIPRADPLIAAAADGLGLDSAAVDDLFRLASTL